MTPQGWQSNAYHRRDPSSAEYVKAKSWLQDLPVSVRGLKVHRPNQVWVSDITYTPMARGFVYLVAVVNWFSRRVLSWRISIGMEVDLCLEAVEEALAKHGKTETLNSDQGSPFTSAAFTGLLLHHGIAISMDSMGA